MKRRDGSPLPFLIGGALTASALMVAVSGVWWLCVPVVLAVAVGIGFAGSIDN